MRPTPAFILAGAVATLLASGPALAAPASKSFSTGTASGSTTTGSTTTTTGSTNATGTTGSTGTTTTGTTGATIGTTTATTGTTGTTTRLSAGLTPGAPVSPLAAPITTDAANAAAGTAINSTTTTFNNGARYIVNADGTVTLLSNIASTSANTTGNTTTAATAGNALAADVLGTSPGQTSIGTTAGASSPGIVDNGSVISTLNSTTGTVGTSGFAPGVVVGGIATSPYVGGMDYAAMTDAGSGVNANGERVASMGGIGSVAGPATATQRTPTATYDMVTRAATARELNRRAKGQTPRIYGIAPRTNNDRTDQMPDDPVIRY